MFSKPVWSPYFAGFLVGLLAILSVFVSTKMLGKPKYLGASTSFVRVCGFMERQIVPNLVAKNEYYQKVKVKVDWQMMFLVGIFFGSLLASAAGKTFKCESVPPMWKDKMGNSSLKRAVFAFIGGVIAILGVRMAGGCPSGHGLSGMMQLALSGMVAMVAFMAGGFITAAIVYKRGRR